jgi:hypothetical protein
MACGHPCMGLCGEVCPTLCRVCQPGHVLPIDLEALAETVADTRLLRLLCGHTFTVPTMDAYMSRQMRRLPESRGPGAGSDDTAAGEAGGAGEETAGGQISLPSCPECRKPVQGVLRYHNDMLKWHKVSNALAFTLILNRHGRELQHYVVRSHTCTTSSVRRLPRPFVYAGARFCQRSFWRALPA